MVASIHRAVERPIAAVRARVADGRHHGVVHRRVLQRRHRPRRLWGALWQPLVPGQLDARAAAAGLASEAPLVPFLELYTLVWAARTWGPEWAGRKIIFHTDCQGMMFACGTMSSKELLELLPHASARPEALVPLPLLKRM